MDEEEGDMYIMCIAPAKSAFSDTYSTGIIPSGSKDMLWVEK